MISQEEFPSLVRKIQDQAHSDTSDEMKKNVRSLPSDKMKQSWSPQRNQIHYPKEQLLILMNTSRLLREVNLRGTIKIFKKLTNCIRACVRLKKLMEQSTQIQSLKKLQTFQKSTLKYQQIVYEKFKAWCLAICFKSFSTIPKDIENYIKFPISNLKRDKCKLSLINSMKFLLENLAYGTHPDNLPNEIKHYLYSQLFEHSKQNFTKFVSERTHYISKACGELTLMQQSMIITEVLFFFRIAFLIIEHSTVHLFVQKMLVSLLQYLFLENHKRMKTTQSIQKSFVHLEFEENSSQKGTLKIVENSQEGSQIILGLYENEQIEEILQMRPIFTEKINQYFEKILSHLQVLIINI